MGRVIRSLGLTGLSIVIRSLDLFVNVVVVVGGLINLHLFNVTLDGLLVLGEAILPLLSLQLLLVVVIILELFDLGRNIIILALEQAILEAESLLNCTASACTYHVHGGSRSFLGRCQLVFFLLLFLRGFYW